MSDTPRSRRGRPSPITTETQVSAGGVAYRRRADATEIVLIAVGPRRRWQLPKGLVDPNEEPAVAARREVREEGGIDATLIEPIETVEYWYVGARGTERVRYHKFVHFFLLSYESGDVRDHDHEVEEARWVPIEDAATLLAFENERRVVDRACEMLATRHD